MGESLNLLSPYFCDFIESASFWLGLELGKPEWVKEGRGVSTGNRYLGWLKDLCLGKQKGWSASIGFLCNSAVLSILWNRFKTRRAGGGAGGGRRSQRHPCRVGDCEGQRSSGGVWWHGQGRWPSGLHPQTLRWRVSCWLLSCQATVTVYSSILVL